MTDPTVEHYARIAAAPDPAIRAGWADYLRERVPEIERDLPGIQDRIRQRARELMKEAAC